MERPERPKTGRGDRREPIFLNHTIHSTLLEDGKVALGR